MDFDDLDDAEVALGPAAEDLRAQLLAKQVPSSMPGAASHPGPPGRNFGPKAALKVLYLHGPGSTEQLSRIQLTNMFNKCPTVADMKLIDWTVLQGAFPDKLEEIHADPRVQDQFRPYGPDFFSHLRVSPYEVQLQAWGGLDAAMDHLAKHLAESGPYDGICGFDMGANVAFNAACLAAAGNEAFKAKFHFLMLFSPTGPKACGYDSQADRPQAGLWPKAPLQIPTLLCFSKHEDDARQFCNYEELAMYIDPKYRVVVVHDQGHRPPNIQKGTPECEVLDKFVTSMQAGLIYKLTELGSSPVYKDMWLPMVREPAPEAAAGSSRKLIVVTDPLGAHGPEATEASEWAKWPAQESVWGRGARFAVAKQVRVTTAEEVKAAVDASGGGEVEVTGVSYKEPHKQATWHPKAPKGPSRWTTVDDEIVLGWTEARRLVDELLEDLAIMPSDSVSVVGLGTGSFVALLLAEALIRIKRVTPTRLWLVCPPPILPLEGMPEKGMLVTVPVRRLTMPYEVTGPSWQAEILTFGEVTHGLFMAKEEMLRMVAQEATSGKVEDFAGSAEKLGKLVEPTMQLLTKGPQ